MNSRPKLNSALAVLATALFTPELVAQTLNWGNTINPEGIPGFTEMSYDSHAVAIDQTGTTFTFELGVFTGGFAPDDSNVDMWGLNWQPLQATTYSPTLNYFTAGYELVAADASLEGSRGYIWVYNNTAGDETSEWFLATGEIEADLTPSDNNWLIPKYEDTLNFPYNWRLSTANTPVWGGLNSVPSIYGIQNVDPVLYELQTFAVPEPSATGLVLLGTLLLMRRRR